MTRMTLGNMENMEYLYGDHPLAGVVKERDKKIAHLYRRINSIERERDELVQEVEALRKKLKMKRKDIARNIMEGR